MHRVAEEPLTETARNLLLPARHHVAADHLGKARPPFARAEPRRRRAIVNHVVDATGRHVGVKRVNRLDDGFVADLAPAMAVLLQNVDLRHHNTEVDAGGGRLDRHCEVALPCGFAGAPHDRAVNLTHRIGGEPIGGVDDTTDLAATGHLIIDLDQDGLGGGIGRVQIMIKGAVLFTRKRFDDAEQPTLRNRLANWPGQTQRAAREGVTPRRIAVEHEITEQRFKDAPDRTQEDTALAEDVAAVFHFQRRLEYVGRADRNCPAEGDVARGPRTILVDCVAGVDSGPVDLFALLEQTSHRWAHTLRAHADDVDVGAKLRALVLYVADEETVRQAE